MQRAEVLATAGGIYNGDMRLYESPGTLKRYRRKAWPVQQTFLTPLNDLELFVAAIMSALPQTESAVAIFQRVVFEPFGLVPLYEKYSLPQKWFGDGLTLEAETAAEAGELLAAVLGEWIDFLFGPTPTPFVIYADHDEYITFLARRKGGLSAVTDALTIAHFRSVDYVREF